MAAKTAVAKTATKARGRPKGLQLTTAQQAAYNKAYTAAATKVRANLALHAAAQGERKYRLQAAHSMVKTYNAAHRSAQTAAIAAAATHRTFVQSRLAHQNSALMHRIEVNMSAHATLAGRLQYIAAGEKAFAHAAVMRTLTTNQALAYEVKVLAKIAKTATKAAKSKLPKFKPGPNSKAIAAAGNKAGLAAAKKVPSSAKGPAPAKGRTAPNYGNVPACTAANAYAQAMYAAHTRAATKTPKSPLRVDWHGDEVTPNCVITAVANHLLHVKGVKVVEHALRELFEACKPEPTIEEVLWQAWLIGWPGDGVHLKFYKPSPFRGGDALYASVIGFEVLCDDGVKRDHAALALQGDKVVSWGKVSDRITDVEEAWDLEWES